MQPTSTAQWEAHSGGRLPALEKVSASTWSLALPIPAGRIKYTLTYLLLDRDGRVHVIDPGWDSTSNWDHLSAAVEIIGTGRPDVASVTVTHSHPDHLGMAARVRERTGAPIALHRLEQAALDGARSGLRPFGEPDLDRWDVPVERRAEILQVSDDAGSLPEFTADILLDDGEMLHIPGRDVQVIHTPGHTAGHICLRDRVENLLFVGDHLLPTSFPGIGIGHAADARALTDYLESLERIGMLVDHEVCPGHGFRFTGIAERGAETAAHHERRSAEVRAVLDRTPTASVWDVASELTWTAGWHRLADFYLASALRQAEMHIQHLRTRDEGGHVSTLTGKGSSS